jgi:hypothetical protein
VTDVTRQGRLCSAAEDFLLAAVQPAIHEFDTLHQRVVLVADLVLPGSEAAAGEDRSRLEIFVDHVVAAPQPNPDRAWVSDDVLR